MRLHDDIAAMRRELADLRRRVVTLERRDDRRNLASPEVIRAVRDKITEASWRFGVEPWEIDGSGRRRDASRARQWVMFEVRAMGHTFQAIGEAMGRDHSTVVSGCHEERIRRSKPLPDNDDSAKIERAEKGLAPRSGSNRNRDLDGGAQHG